MTATIQLPGTFRPLRIPARYKGVYGGRGSGKSYAFATMVVLAMSQGKRIVCLREIQKSIKDSVKALIEAKIAEIAPALFTVLEHEIRGPNGSICIFRGLQNHTADSIKSLEGFDVAWVEEAQTVTQNSLDILTPTIRAPGSEIWFSWNPRKADDPIDVFLRGEPPEGAIVIEANHDSNPWFPDELRIDMERDRKRDPEKYRHIWLGAYQTHSAARIFSNWRMGEMAVSDRVRWFYGADWGFANDPTAAVRCCIPTPGVLYIDHDASEVGCPMERLPFLLGKIPGARDWPMRADSARPETIDYVKRHGFRKIRAATKGKGSVEDGIEFLRGFDIVVHPRCAHVEAELTQYSYRIDKHTGEILPIVEDAHNHCIDALRYSVEGLHRKGKMIPLADAPARPRSVYYDFNEPDEVNWKAL